MQDKSVSPSWPGPAIAAEDYSELYAHAERLAVLAAKWVPSGQEDWEEIKALMVKLSELK